VCYYDIIQPIGCICNVKITGLCVVSMLSCLYSFFKGRTDNMGKIFNNAEIGLKIREFRLQAGYSQEKFAEELEITFQQVQKYERGVTKVNLEKLQQIAKVLKVPVSSFFDDSSCSAYQLSNEEKTLLEAFRRIKTASHRDSVLNIVIGLMRKKL
jgi:transcriptional regulator with XRE-family HTH domain